MAERNKECALRTLVTMRARLIELIRFGSIGALAYVVDVGLFTLERFGPGTLLGDRPLADDISANVVGLVLGTAFRHLAYRRVVVTGILGSAARAPVSTTAP